MLKKDFDSELEGLLQGISKIQEFGDSVRSKTNFGNSINYEDKLTLAKTSKHLNLAEVTRQSMRPEAAVWLGFAALISASNQHSKETRRLASKLGGHLARRRARPLGGKFGEFKNITISPRCRKVVGSLHELGCEITEVFGVWLKMKSYISTEEVKKKFWMYLACNKLC